MCALDKNCAFRVETMAETHHSVTNTSGIDGNHPLSVTMDLG